MARLLAPLEQISQQHPEPVIQELASDLRATIATRGAYHSDSVTNAAQCNSHSTYAQTKNQKTSQNQKNPVKPSGISERPKVKEVREQAPSFQHTDGKNGKSFIPKPESTHVSASTAPENAFSERLLEACDPDVPTRAMALRALTKCVKEGTKEALEGHEKVLMVSQNFEGEKSA